MSIAWGMWADIGMAKRVVDAAASGAADPHAHPLLGVRTDDEDGVIRFSATYAAERLWVLAEHRIDGFAVLPGTAYIEIANAAALRGGLGASVALRHLNFLSPLIVSEGRSRQARVTLSPLADDGYRIEVESRANAAEEWQLHFEAQIGAFTAAPAPIEPVQAEQTITAERLLIADRGVDFGPRWRNVRVAARGEGVVSAEFALSKEFADDVRTFRAHPALLDTAAATGLFLIDADGDGGVYAPVSMEAVRLFSALPAELYARARMVSAPDAVDAVFDVDISDASGAVIARNPRGGVSAYRV
ncbi:MAG: polyketide synthase dehydratase domain-containing protein [Terricaulis sp.]|nr:polyketide synthase dehydratase domain-containing protein [Terricaulis sp.]